MWQLRRGENPRFGEHVEPLQPDLITGLIGRP
jgi:hypothetical protein